MQSVIDARTTADAHQRDADERVATALARTFWGLAVPVCLLFWAAIAYFVHSAL